MNDRPAIVPDAGDAYHARREREERDRALAARDPAVRWVHRAFAARYAALRREGGFMLRDPGTTERPSH